LKISGKYWEKFFWRFIAKEAKLGFNNYTKTFNVHD